MKRRCTRPYILRAIVVITWILCAIRHTTAGSTNNDVPLKQSPAAPATKRQLLHDAAHLPWESFTLDSTQAQLAHWVVIGTWLISDMQVSRRSVIPFISRLDLTAVKRALQRTLEHQPEGSQICTRVVHPATNTTLHISEEHEDDIVRVRDE